MRAATPRPRSLVVALTGGIATGKSAVTRLFQKLHVDIFDADVVARELVTTGSPALAEIVAAFGAASLTDSGELDRPRMRERVFLQPDDRRRLESILHPRIRTELNSRAHACAADYCILAIPLLAESRENYAWVDRVLVVDAPREVQIARLMLRDGSSIEHAARMLDAQATRDQRLALADDVIENSGAARDLEAIVTRLDARYRAMASAR